MHDLGVKLTADLRLAVERGDESFEVIVNLRPERSLDPDPTRRTGEVGDMVESSLRATRAGLAARDLEVQRRFRLNPGYSATVSRDGLEALAQRDEVLQIEMDRRWPLHTAEGMAVIKADVLQFYGITGDDTALAIIDTGIDYLHPSLGGGAIPNAKVVHGLDLADGDDDPYDCSGHGTAVAAVAAGASYQWTPNRRFAGGVAPEAHILAYKAASDRDCGGLIQSAVVAAIEDAVLHDADMGYRLAAINISAGSGSYSGACDGDGLSYTNAVRTAVENGIAVVASAGNDGRSGELPAPACLGNVISVGSVWDTTPSDSAGFCLDATCTRVCSDLGNAALSVACYSNSSAMLDLLAPSEVLTTAMLGGQTAEFGGTSGAAPYVAGAIALLVDAVPTLDPVQIRLLLELTGTPVVDTKTGTMSPLLDLERALDLDGIAFGDASVSTIPPDRVNTLEDRTWIDADGLVGDLRVVLRLVHPDPSLVRVTLTSPGGRVVSLHDASLGTHGTDPSDGQALGGIFAVYPDTAYPAQDLGVMANQPLRGEWVLRVDTEPTAEKGHVDPVLIGWALAFEAKVAPAPPAETSLFLPVTARAPGSLGTQWSSDLRILNPVMSSTAAARLYLVPSGADGKAEFEQRDLLLAPNSLLDLTDVLAERFALDTFQGQIIIQTLSGSLISSSRIVNQSDAGGTFGQLVPAVAASEGLAHGQPPLSMPHLSSGFASRTNIGLAETVGSIAEVEVVLRDGRDGRRLGEPIREVLLPFSHVQLNRVFDLAGAEPSDNAYASVVDNQTGDAIFIQARTAAAATAWTVPVVAHTPGQADTRWVSDLRVANFGATPVNLAATLSLAGQERGSVQEAELAVPPGAVLAADDVVLTLFGRDDATGALHLETTGAAAPVMVTSRTYNLSDVGTYGQFIPAVTAGLTADSTLIQLEKSSAYRSNVGFAEVDGGTVELRYSLKDPSGHQVGSAGSLSLGPRQLVQVNDIFTALGVPPTAAARLDISFRGGSGSYVAYASVIDQVTGDAVFELATHPQSTN